MKVADALQLSGLCLSLLVVLWLPDKGSAQSAGGIGPPLSKSVDLERNDRQPPPPPPPAAPGGGSGAAPLPMLGSNGAPTGRG
jgi:hypothetical protein